MVSEESVTNHSAGSPWWWDDLDDDERAQNWQGLAWWVDWLVDAYSPWVALPPCWALHEGIATELKVFWNWHALAIKVESSPADAIRWHQELRTSATAWRELANCKHEPQLVQLSTVSQRRREKASAYIAQAVERDRGNQNG